MLDIVVEKLKKILTSRLLPIALIYIALIAILINRLFVLQIVQGPTEVAEQNFKKTKSREIKSTRGNIYDRKGKLLATNVLSYSVMIEDSTELTSNEQRNEVILRLINIIEENGTTLDTEFYIIKNEQGELEFTVKDSALTRFLKNAFTYVLEDNQLTEEQKNATPEEVFEFLKHGQKNITNMFDISDDYTTEEAIKIMAVRYALLLNYPKYLQITVASSVSEETVAAIMEDSALLPGVEIKQQSKRYYYDSPYFAHMLGYTGLISADELAGYEEAKNENYNSSDIIGKTGLEKEYEEYLSGTKGSEIVTVNNFGKVVEVVDRTEPTAGNDLYLTIDSDLQKAAYHILEKKIAGILIGKLRPDMNYGSKGESAADILTPIYEVYNALINNNIIDIHRFSDPDSSDLEHQVYQKFQSQMQTIFAQLDSLLAFDNTKTSNTTGDMEDYLDYFYKVLGDKEILLTKQIPIDDPTTMDYRNDKISLSSFLQYAISKNWIDLSKLNVGDEYYSAEELYTKLISYTKDILKDDGTFNKKIYRNLVFSYKLSGTEICLLLFEQGVLEYNKETVDSLKSGHYSPYDFMKDKLISLEITPAMLALEPCSGSLVVTDVRNGDVLALVTYPSYDNNLLANKVDSDYYNQLLDDLSYPLMNRPTYQRTAPGSTFKMLTSVASLEEGIISPTDRILDLGEFTRINPPAKCHIYPGSHGSVNIVDALKVSCNFFFYEMGFSLSVDSTGKFKEQYGLERLAKYASLFGLDVTSGIELSEAEPHVSDKDPVRSAIGQGSNVYTPVQLARYVTTLANRGTCYNLTIMDKIVDKDGQVIVNNDAAVYQDLSNVKESTWDTVQSGMYSVVNAPGGSVYQLYKNFGVTVAGKTGTSQISKVNLNNALFVSYAPYQNPEISVTAVIPNGNTSSNAAELVRDIYKYYYNLEEPDDVVGGEVTVPEANNDTFSD
ncbi:MAG: hypothetical protein K0S47_1702 [Herbinix sp.]|nr:hypothetical protein [Herbinix sp.]